MFYGLVLSTARNTHWIYLLLIKRRSIFCRIYVPVTQQFKFSTDTWSFSDIAQCPEKGVQIR